jgi:hypothetical protein
MAGKEARAVCTALRTAHGPPGSGLTLARSQHSPPVDAHQPYAPLIDTRLRNWPQPSDVTQLRALSFLPATTCEALSRTFPSLQALTILRGMEACDGVGPAITRLFVAGCGAQHREEVPLQACLDGAFPALRSLTVTGCQHLLQPSDLSPLALLTQLTSLTLAAAKSPITYKQGLGRPPCAMDDEPVPCGGGSGAGADAGGAGGSADGGTPSNMGTPLVRHASDDSEEVYSVTDEVYSVTDEAYSVTDDDSVAEQPEGTQSVWAVLAALPKLARLCLDVPFDYHSGMLPGARPLGALTHLAVRSEPTMTMPDTLREVEMPFLQVRVYVGCLLPTAVQYFVLTSGVPPER